MFAYPEGTCMFNKNGIKFDYYDATNPERFYQFALIEVIFNYCDFTGWPDGYPWSQRLDHPRASYDVYSSFMRNSYRCINSFTVWHGKSYKEMTRKTQIFGSRDYNEYWECYNNGTQRTKIFAVHMPPKGQKLYIDCTLPIRAVYFPVAHEAHPSYRQLGVWMQVRFDQRLDNDMWVDLTKEDNDGKWILKVRQDAQLGFKYVANGYLTMELDVARLYNWLLIPWEQRKEGQGLYYRIIREAPGIYVEGQDGPRYYTSMAKIISEFTGQQYSEPPPPELNWMKMLIEKAIVFGLGLIPGVGPVLAVAASVGLQAINNPESFTSENALGLSTDILFGVVGSAKEMKSNVKAPKSTVKSRMAGPGGAMTKEKGAIEEKPKEPLVMIIHEGPTQPFTSNATPPSPTKGLTIFDFKDEEDAENYFKTHPDKVDTGRSLEDNETLQKLAAWHEEEQSKMEAEPRRPTSDVDKTLKTENGQGSQRLLQDTGPSGW